MKSPMRILLGPTASGKESLALHIAEAEGSEIISVDSMKIYRGLDIGTAKATPEMRQTVPHHCLDIADPSQPFSVADYVAAAEQKMDEISSRDGSFILSGGTALYYKGLTEGLFDGPGADPELRHDLTATGEAEGSAVLHDELARLDPISAERIHPNDLKRIVRALEVVKITGVPISRQQTQFGRQRSDRPVVMAGLLWPRPVLHERISKRVGRMLEQGLVEEARNLYESQPPLAKQARAAVGYAELFAHFAGDYDYDTAVELIRRNTRRLAKSQMTWFRKFPCRWIEMEEGMSTSELARQVREIWAAGLEE